MIIHQPISPFVRMRTHLKRIQWSETKMKILARRAGGLTELGHFKIWIWIRVCKRYTYIKLMLSDFQTHFWSTFQSFLCWWWQSAGCERETCQHHARQSPAASERPLDLAWCPCTRPTSARPEPDQNRSIPDLSGSSFLSDVNKELDQREKPALLGNSFSQPTHVSKL